VIKFKDVCLDESIKKSKLITKCVNKITELGMLRIKLENEPWETRSSKKIKEVEKEEGKCWDMLTKEAKRIGKEATENSDGFFSLQAEYEDLF